jgi:hypothetical protein
MIASINKTSTLSFLRAQNTRVPIYVSVRFSSSCSCSSTSCFSNALSATFSQPQLLRFLNSDARNEKIITVKGGERKTSEEKRREKKPFHEIFTIFMYTKIIYSNIASIHREGEMIKLTREKEKTKKAASGHPRR